MTWALIALQGVSVSSSLWTCPFTKITISFDIYRKNYVSSQGNGSAVRHRVDSIRLYDPQNHRISSQARIRSTDYLFYNSSKKSIWQNNGRTKTAHKSSVEPQNSSRGLDLNSKNPCLISPKNRAEILNLRPWNGDLRHKKTSKTNPGGLERKTRLELFFRSV